MKKFIDTSRDGHLLIIAIKKRRRAGNELSVNEGCTHGRGPRAVRREGQTKHQRGDPLSADQALAALADWLRTTLAAIIPQGAVARYTKTSHTPPNFSWYSCMKSARCKARPLTMAADNRLSMLFPGYIILLLVCRGSSLR